MRRLAAALLALPVSAGAAVPAGDYTHDFTEPANAVVWSVMRGAGGVVVRDASGTLHRASDMDASARMALWTRLDWPADTVHEAQCIRWSQAADPDALAPWSHLCEVPAAARARIAWIAGHASDSLYYDEALGVMEIRRIP
ncbi:hypothetical protein [Lysobacter humi (ex Lee et al. 2017)]